MGRSRDGRRLVLITGVTLSGACGVVGGGGGGGEIITNPPPPSMADLLPECVRVDPESVDLGTVILPTDAEAPARIVTEIELVNECPEPLVVEDLSFASASASEPPWSLGDLDAPIEPGGFDTFDIVLEPTEPGTFAEVVEGVASGVFAFGVPVSVTVEEPE